MVNQYHSNLSPCSSSSSLASSVFAFPPRHRCVPSISPSDSESLSSGYESSFSNAEYEDNNQDDDSLNWKFFCDNSKAFGGPLIPGLTDDVALLCLSKVSFSQRFRLASVSRLWREVIYSDSIYNIRRSHNFLQNCFCVCFLSQARELQLNLKAFNISTQEWFKLPSLNLGYCGEFYDLWDLQLIPIGSNLFAIGGTIRERGTSIVSAVRKDIWQLDLITCCWQPGPPIAVHGRRTVAAGDSVAELIFVAASNEPQEAGSQPSIALFCTATGEWIQVTAMPPLSRRRYLHGASCCRGLFHLFLIDPDSGAQWAEIYNPSDSTWKRVENLPTRKAVVASDGELWTVENGPLHKGKDLGIEKYNWEDNAWESIAKLKPGLAALGQARSTVASCFLASVSNELCVLKAWQELVSESHWERKATVSIVLLDRLDKTRNQMKSQRGSMFRRLNLNSAFDGAQINAGVRRENSVSSTADIQEQVEVSSLGNPSFLDGMHVRNVHGVNAVAFDDEHDGVLDSECQSIDDANFRHLVVQTEGDCVGCAIIAV